MTMFVETPQGTFINLMKMEMIGPGSDQTEEELKAGAKFSDDSLCAWTVNKLEGKSGPAHTLLPIPRSQDPLLWEWVNFNLRSAFIKRHWFISMKDIILSWTLRRQDCINSMNAQQKLMVSANLGSHMGDRQYSSHPAATKPDKALYGSIEKFMDHIGLETSSPLRLHFASNKAAGFDELAALIAPIIAESKKVSNFPIMDESYQGDNGKPVSSYKINSSITKLSDAWDAMTVNYSKPDHQADQVVVAIKEGDLSQQEEPSLIASSTERELQPA